jgi:hypothetical protein
MALVKKFKKISGRFGNKIKENVAAQKTFPTFHSSTLSSAYK